MEEVKFLDPAVNINMNNYKPYSNTKELRAKATEYLETLKGKEFSLEESNPEIKFMFSSNTISHIIGKSGDTKIIITRHLPEIFKQGYVLSVEDEVKGDKTIKHILKCGTYIMMNGELYQFRFVLKMKHDGKNFLYDGTINVNMREKDRTA